MRNPACLQKCLHMFSQIKDCNSYSSIIICNNSELTIIQISNNNWIDQLIVICPHRGISYSIGTEQSTNTCNNINGSYKLNGWVK